MNDLYFIGMNITEETRELVYENIVTRTKDMTDSEREAYELGIESTLNALMFITTPEHNNEFVIDIQEIETDFYGNIDDLTNYLSSIYDDEE